MRRYNVGDKVRLPGAPLYGLLTIADSPHNRDPWGCTRNCRDTDCRELQDFQTEDGDIEAIHVNECELVPA